MKPKSLLAAGVVIAFSLSPSIAECFEAHSNDNPQKWVLWGWIFLVIIIALMFGKEFFAQ